MCQTSNFRASQVHQLNIYEGYDSPLDTPLIPIHANAMVGGRPTLTLPTPL